MNLLIKRNETCCECGEDVKQGSGRFVNRVLILTDYEEKVANGYKFPKGEYICACCWEEFHD